MYNFSLFNTYNIAPNDELILLGMQMKYFDYDVAKDYIYWKMENDIPTAENEISILDCSDAESAISILTDAGISLSGKTQRVLRYLVLRGLTSTGKSLLHEIESIYADFNYPTDMEAFIYYMPFEPMDDDPSNTDSTNILINRFNKFLDAEYASISC